MLAAAAGLLAGVAVLTYSRWPDGRREVASTGSNTIGQMLPIPTWSGSANEDDGAEPLPPTVRDVRVVQGADGQPVGIRLRRESVAYQLDVERAPDGTPAVTAASQEDSATAADPRSFRPGRLRLQVERVTPVFLPLPSWPYE